MIIDIHAHLWGGAYIENKRQIIRSAELFGLNRVFISSIQSYNPDEEEIEFLNNLTLGFMKEEPELIGGFVYLNPRHRDKTEVMKRYIGEGMKGVKIWVSVLCDDPSVNEIAENCIRMNVPVLVHSFHKATGQLENETTSVNVRTLALRYPELRIIMAHMGGNPYHGLRCIHDLPNVFPDISGTPIGRGEIDYAVSQVGVSRLLFGTDMPYGGRQCIAQMEDSSLSEDDKKKVYYKNAMKVLGIDGI
ncbi:MAG TPA: amidohydrolase family protein [Clostridia bacterium]|nr:amidohydrolase family protein [Clostridia bacterium]